MTHASLFSGIGGFDLAAQWAGWTNVFNCEIDPFCQTVLKYHFPDAKQYSDIRATDFSIWRGRIDVLTGGFPCQPFSVAGKRRGTDDNRYLWPEMLRAIREISPRWIVGENVRGIVNWSNGLVFEQVCVDLEAEGYEVQPFILPACGIGAPHRRDRVWFVAHNNNNGHSSSEIRQGLGKRDDSYKARAEQAVQFARCSNESTAIAAHCSNSRVETMQQRGKDGVFGLRIITDTKSQQSQWLQSQQRKTSEPQQGQFRRSNNKNATTDSSSGGRLQNDQDQRAREPKQNIPNWRYFPTQPPVCSRNDGLSDRLDGITFPKWRSESTKAFGNAVVPQVPYKIFKTINQYEQLAIDNASL